MARKAMRVAEHGVRADVSRLVASVPDLLREARRFRVESAENAPTLAQLAAWALPRLAAATAVAVFVATSFVSWELRRASAATFDSVILGAEGDGAGDATFVELLDLEGSDG